MVAYAPFPIHRHVGRFAEGGVQSEDRTGLRQSQRHPHGYPMKAKGKREARGVIAKGTDAYEITSFFSMSKRRKAMHVKQERDRARNKKRQFRRIPLCG